MKNLYKLIFVLFILGVGLYACDEEENSLTEPLLIPNIPPIEIPTACKSCSDTINSEQYVCSTIEGKIEIAYRETVQWAMSRRVLTNLINEDSSKLFVIGYMRNIKPGVYNVLDSASFIDIRFWTSVNNNNVVYILGNPDRLNKNNGDYIEVIESDSTLGNVKAIFSGKMYGLIDGIGAIVDSIKIECGELSIQP